MPYSPPQIVGVVPTVVRRRTMRYWKIWNTESGLFLGVFEAEDVDGALDAMARDAGYRDYDHMCEVVGPDSDDGLRVEEIEERYITIRVPARKYAAFDNCLEAAADEQRELRGLYGYDLGARWEDDDLRDYILLDIPIEDATIEEIMEHVERTA